MMRGNSLPNEEIKKYLFDELTDAEREEFEERLFGEDDYVYEVMELENELVDRYALGKLEGSELERFERSLKRSPSRRDKVSNGVALQRRISEERQTEAARMQPAVGAVARAPLWERIAKLFSFQTPSFQYAAAGLVILLGLGLAYLWADRLRLGRELARLREGASPEAQRRERELEERIEAALERESELKRQLESERGKSQDLSEQLEGEGAEREKLQRELERLRRERGGAGSAPAVASVLLLPTGRGVGGAAEVTIGADTARVVLRLELDDAVKPEGLFSVEVNGRTVAAGLLPRQTSSGKRLVTVSVPPRSLSDGVNKVILKNKGDLPVGDYELRVSRR